MKEGTSAPRGIAGSGMLFAANFASNSLKISENKEQLNLFLAKELLRLYENDTQELLTTFNVLSTHDLYIYDVLLNKCKAEEADTNW